MKKIIIIAGILLLLAIAGFFSFNEKSTGQVVSSEQNPIVEFKVNAFRFGYSPNIINVKQGDLVKITIDNTDTKHGIRIPDLGLSGTDNLEFTADQKGEFIWYCYVPCGSGHREMQGKIIIE